MEVNRHRSRGARGSRGGYTLVEVMVASGLVLIGCIGLYSGSITVRKMTAHNRMSGEATDLARGQMESVLSVGFDKIVQQVPYADITNMVFDEAGGAPIPVVLRTSVVGHSVAGADVPVAFDNAYMEIVVDSVAPSMLNGRLITNSMATVVCRPPRMW